MLSKAFFPNLLIVFSIGLAFNCISPSAKPNNIGSSALANRPSVEIRKTTDGNLAALIKNYPDFPRTVFLLQLTNKATLSSPIILSDAIVNYQTDHIFFRSRITNEYVVFQLTGATPQIPDTGINIGGFSGFGLTGQLQEVSVYNAMITNNDTTFPPTSALVSCTCNAAAVASTGCISGGQGASSCTQSEGGGGGVTVMGTGGNTNSTSSCKVTCTQGYYACCTVS